jgi:hypothetical protein
MSFSAGPQQVNNVFAVLTKTKALDVLLLLLLLLLSSTHRHHDTATAANNCHHHRCCCYYAACLPVCYVLAWKVLNPNKAIALMETNLDAVTRELERSNEENGGGKERPLVS